jgi:type I restriction enzyme S subunit
MTEMPKGWARTNLGQIASVLRGVTYRKEDARDRPAQGLVPLLRATNISSTLSLDEVLYVPEKYVSSEQLLCAGDVVIAASSGSKSIVGKAALLDHDWFGTFGAFCAVVRPDARISFKFLGYALQTAEYRSYVSACAAGVNINNLKASHLNDYNLPLAPVNEQELIVDEIEKQFSRLDAATAALKRVHANLKRYRASVLKAACEGHLVPTEAELARKEGREYEPADKLLERILRERRARWEVDTRAKMIASGKPPADDRWKQKYKEPSAPKTGGLPALPKGWCWACFDQVAWRVRSGTAETSSRDTTDYPVLKSSAVRPGRVDFTDVNYLRADQSSRLENFVEKGDLLITRLSGSLEYVAQCAHIADLPPHGIQYPDRLFCAKLVDGVVGQFLSYCFQHQPLRAALEQAAKSTAGHQRISMTDLFSFTFPLPPLSEQHRISSALDRHVSFVERLINTVRNEQKKADHSRLSILKEAFSSNLVPQDPTDEPASMLLERIRTERVASTSGTSSRRRLVERVHA